MFYHNRHLRLIASIRNKVRTFFALAIDSRLQHAIGGWRAAMLPSVGRQVAVENLHITLCFLGRISEQQLTRVTALAGRVHAEPFELRIDRLGYFAKSGILWLGATDTPPALNDLAEQLRTVAGRAGIKTDSRAFRPHITLCRRCNAKPPAPGQQPVFQLECRAFTLFESVTGQTGVYYKPLATWKLA